MRRFRKLAVVGRLTAIAAARAALAAFGVLLRFEVTDFAFVFLLFAHGVGWLLVFWVVVSCVSRAEETPSTADDLFIGEQVIQANQLLFRTLLPLSTRLTGIGVFFFLRRTHGCLLTCDVPHFGAAAFYARRILLNIRNLLRLGCFELEDFFRDIDCRVFSNPACRPSY